MTTNNHSNKKKKQEGSVDDLGKTPSVNLTPGKKNKKKKKAKKLLDLLK